MRYLDYFLLFGGLVSMIYLCRLSFIERNQLIENILDPKNKESVLKACFYDEFEKKNVIKRLRILEDKIDLSLRSMDISLENRYKLEQELLKVNELKSSIESGDYVRKLVELSPEERRLDNWDDF
ncbi:hypothetical protein BCR22_11660 [Enterococcus plantarum]|uniref:hypothetical protein n=1 Tax=Enterococcus plantarum TaxID=1077675 RepID=UPI00084DD897|nr:hypothetical protein [Enterococcus plantarum]OEG18021.1 hypothetical protein BCR22_11660 [Enterococcus plantarum]